MWDRYVFVAPCVPNERKSHQRENALEAPAPLQWTSTPQHQARGMYKGSEKALQGFSFPILRAPRQDFPKTIAECQGAASGGCAKLWQSCWRAVCGRLVGLTIGSWSFGLCSRKRNPQPGIPRGLRPYFDLLVLILRVGGSERPTQHKTTFLVQKLLGPNHGLRIWPLPYSGGFEGPWSEL